MSLVESRFGGNEIMYIKGVCNTRVGESDLGKFKRE